MLELLEDETRRGYILLQKINNSRALNNAVINTDVLMQWYNREGASLKVVSTWMVAGEGIKRGDLIGVTKFPGVAYKLKELEDKI